MDFFLFYKKMSVIWDKIGKLITQKNGKKLVFLLYLLYFCLKFYPFYLTLTFCFYGRKNS